MKRDLCGLLLAASLALASYCEINALEVTLVVEETIDVVGNPNNGASPLWCYGSSIFVRDGDELFLSLLRPDADYQPSCNAHWELWNRSETGWKKMFQGGAGLEREPCPIGLFGKGELLLSIQPKFVAKPFRDGEGDVPWYCAPGLLEIFPASRNNDKVFKAFHPTFPPGSQFTQHSYRGFGVDPANRELLLLILDQREENYQPTWLRRDGTWQPLPLLTFPVRACYPQIAIQDRAAHVLAIGDIYEPVEAWREFKYAKLKRKWDYAFRRLFYTWSPDLGEQAFCKAVEIDTVDDTAGYLLNLDLHVDDRGRAHVLYLKKPYQYDFMRDRFFPGAAMTVSLEYAVLEQGKLISRKTLLKGSAEENFPDEMDKLHVWSGRFHPLTDGSLGVLYSGAWTSKTGDETSGMFFAQLSKEGILSKTVRLPVSKTLTGMYFTNSPRSGSYVGNHLDIIGGLYDGNSYEMRYLGFEVEVEP